MANQLRQSFKDEDKKYNSVIQEYKRHFTVKKGLKNDYKTTDEAWEHFNVVLRRVYSFPKDKIFFQGFNFKHAGLDTKISLYIDGPKRKEIAFEAIGFDKSSKKVSTDSKFTTGYVVRKSLITNKIIIKYTEHVYAYEELFGLRGALAKWGWKSEVKKNKKLLEKEISKEFQEWGLH